MDSKGHVIWDPDPPKTDEEIVNDHLEEEVFDPTTKTIDFRKIRPTNVKNNPKVIMPDPRPPVEEAHLLTRRTLAHLEASRFIQNMKVQCNLTPSEKRGIKKLTKRVKAGELVVGETDKSGKIFIASMEAYIQMGDKHASKDREAEWSEVREAQSIIKGTLKAMNRAFNTGENAGEKGMSRAWEAKELESMTIPTNSYTVKDHKPCDSEGLPKTRPLCGAHRSMNGEISEWVSDIVVPAIRAKGSKEAISTEDVLSMVDQMVPEILQKGLGRM